MATATQGKQGEGKTARQVVSIPGELVAAVDKAIHEDAGEALKALGVEAESLRQGFVAKLIREGLERRKLAEGK